MARLRLVALGKGQKSESARGEARSRRGLELSHARYLIAGEGRVPPAVKPRRFPPPLSTSWDSCWAEARLRLL
jgi:hypothetical protein